MNKVIYCLLALFWIAGNAYALEEGNVVKIEYDLQGGTNSPDNPTSLVYDKEDMDWLYLQPPTKEGADFLGWYLKKDSLYLYQNDKVDHLVPAYASYDTSSSNTITVSARWGVVAQTPKRDESGCILVNNAAELYGALKMSDSIRTVCISIQQDIVVNKDVLADDGTPNKGDFFWWRPFKRFNGVIEGNGHYISGLYGDVGLIESPYINQIVVQNLGIVDSYFSGYQVGSFLSNLYYYQVKLINVYSTATVNGIDGTAGGLVGIADTEGDACLDVVDAPRAQSPSAYFDEQSYKYHSPKLIVENAYFAGHVMGKYGGGLAGSADLASVKNSFFAGTSDVSSDFAAIGLTMPKMCSVVQDGDLHSENTYYLDSFEQDDFKATAASSSEFADGTILAKLNEGNGMPIWKQTVGTDKYPKLQGAYYNIKYVLNGGVNDSMNPSYYAAREAVSLKPATKEGDTFEGWFLDSNFKTPVEKILETDWGDQKFFAKWESGYSITYVNDDTYLHGLHPNPTYRYADSATFTLKEPIGTGRTFDGWYTDSTFTTKVTELPAGNTEDIVLYAKWISREITLIYNLHGGSMGTEKNPEKVMNGETINLKNPTREGFIFKGWYDGSRKYESLKGYLDEPYLVNTDYSQINFHAKWTYEPKKPAIDTEGCYMITNANELYYFSPYAKIEEARPFNPCVKIMNDIVVNEGIPQDRMEVIEWEPWNSRTQPFVGIVYGNGHTIHGLYMNYTLTYPGGFYGFMSDIAYNGDAPEVKNLGLLNFLLESTFYTYTVFINYKGSGAGIKSGIHKDIAPAPLMQNRLPKYDAKGRALKVHPNYGVLF